MTTRAQRRPDGLSVMTTLTVVMAIALAILSATLLLTFSRQELVAHQRFQTFKDAFGLQTALWQVGGLLSDGSILDERKWKQARTTVQQRIQRIRVNPDAASFPLLLSSAESSSAALLRIEELRHAPGDAHEQQRLMMMVVMRANDSINNATRRLQEARPMHGRRRKSNLLFWLTAVSAILAVAFAILAKISERARRRIAASLETLMETTPEILFSVDGAGDLLRWNRRLESVTGASYEEVAATRLLDFFVEESRPAISQAMLDALDHGIAGSEADLLRKGDTSIRYQWVFSAMVAGPRGATGLTAAGRDVSAHRLVERDLRSAEEREQAVFQHMKDAVCISEHGHFVQVNPAALELFGYSRDQMIGMSAYTLFVDPSDGDRLLQAIERSNAVGDFEIKLRHRNGRVMDCLISATARLDEQERMIGLYSFIRDVTDRRLAEEAIRESEEKLRLLVTSVTDYAIFMLDPEGKIVSWNEGAERITGYSEDEALGQWHGLTYLPGQIEERNPARDIVTAAAHGGLQAEDWRRRKDGSQFFANIILQRLVDGAGRLRGFAEIIRDDSTRKELETEKEHVRLVMQEVAREWTGTFDAVQSPVVLLDVDGRVRRLNRAARELAGLSFTEMLQTTVDDMRGEPWSTIAGLVHFYRQNRVPIEARAHSDELGKTWQVAMSVADLGGAEQQRLIVIAHDLTLVAQLEESLRKSEVSSVLGSLVAGVAHEVRNPLFTISATIDACEARLGDDSSFKRYLAPLRGEIGRLNTLMQELLEYGKPHPLSPQFVSVSSAVRSAVLRCRALAERSQVELRSDVHQGGDEPTMIDHERMSQVFQNLIENAIQHSPAGACVRTFAERLDGWIQCSVVDEGPGFSEDDLKKSFEPFYTRRKGGTGLGLAIVKRIVLAHGGNISLANRKNGRGAKVTISIPRLTT